VRRQVTTRLRVVRSLLLHPGAFLVYASWASAALFAEPGMRLRVSVVLSSTSVGSWLLAATIVDVAARRYGGVFGGINAGRALVSVGSFMEAAARLTVRAESWLDLAGSLVMIAGIAVIVRGVVTIQERGNVDHDAARGQMAPGDA